MFAYQEMISDVMGHGRVKQGRNGLTRSLFGYQFRHSMMDGFPLLTTKQMSFRSVVGELKWMLSGSTDVTELKERYGVSFWDEWGPDIGPGYGHQIRSFGGNHHMNPVHHAYGQEIYPYEGTDQLSALIDELIADPNSRRHIVTHWDPNSVGNTKLPPCHLLWQVNVNTSDVYLDDGSPEKIECMTVDLQMYQRSADLFLGVPYNIAYYGLLLELISAELSENNSIPVYAGDLIISFGDLHLYENSWDLAEQQAQKRAGRLPDLEVDYKKGDLLTGAWQAKVKNYVHQGKMNVDVMV